MADRRNHSILYFTAVITRNTDLEQNSHKVIQQLITDCKAKSPRIRKLGKRGLFFNHSIICAYAPREDIFGAIKKLVQFVIDTHEETMN
jgi:predicted Ser/Thr protein kinase